MLSIFLIALVVSLIINLTFFAFAYLNETDKFTDLSYGLSFVIVTWAYFLTSGGSNVQMLVTWMVTLWGVRLAGFLFYRILKLKKDHRFDGIREDTIKFAKFWIMQAVAVWIILWPIIAILDYHKPMQIGFWTILGAVIWLKGWIIETMADWQKSAFKSNPHNKHKWVNIGLWKYSRHPNYFGEMLCWWGIFVISIPYLTPALWLVICGPIFITYLLLKVTGIPPLEKKYAETYGKNPEYLQYRNQTNLLIPLPKGRQNGRKS
jgi:steroid 5-alpha reductase family enzyme